MGIGVTPKAGPTPDPFFMHIPKAGGTSVAIAALDYGVYWGPAHDVKPQTLTHGKKCPWDHIPPSYLSSRGWRNPYAESTVWCTTRHPTPRILSVYKQLVQNPEIFVQIDIPPGWFSMDHCTPAALNTFIKDALEEYKSGKHFTRGCFVQPQSSQIWDGEKQWCQHVLRLEDGLQSQVNELMARLGSPVRLPPDSERAGTTATKVCKNLSIRDFTDDSLQLIHEVYHDDFVRLGYVKGVDMPGLAPFPIASVHPKENGDTIYE